MTRNLVIATILSMVLIVVLFIGGLAGNNPVLLMPALLCAAPSFFFCLGAAVGRASNEFQVVRKDVRTQGQVINPRNAKVRSENMM
ncbi:MAG: hypothetical protein K8L97_15180 [Anaerolineae bacterium]|nr:hypothetical protein [Anaerolineae bacterium]